MNPENKNILVTGGANGIGKKLVNKLIEKGANIGVLDINKNDLDELKSENKNLYCRVCDVSNPEQVKKSVEDFYDKFNSIDVLVNNAAFIYNSPLISFSADGIKKHSIEEWNKVIATGLSSVLFMTMNVVEKMMLKRTKGVIINVSSVCAAGNAGQSAYSAAKAGVNALTKTWAKELSLQRIRVAGIAPGYSDTETTRNSVSEDFLNDLKKKVPSRRMGKPDEIADGILFVLQNDFYNGKILELDGGLQL